ncbi:nucleotide kinase domain-containing protein [Verrucomicrobium sp. BvORR034]|uniref:nucleotide kinase domain-containing protein n=1 Tax=Verrucomicrobium sp. BvORR034 TaxID=1396418 RepID=UPI002240F86B|nr:nucleotide kinase domain-containing protein [Verrucomicrobium sp. BvORR034]
MSAPILESASMEEGFHSLRSYPSIGNFLAYQYITDLNYSSALKFDEMEFVVAGPGAVDGIHKCFSNAEAFSEAEIIRKMAKMQESEFERLGLNFRDLWGRRLQLIDCQNLFCEVSKYTRVSHPDIAGRNGRTRIKQKFTPQPGKISYWYPPKWGINECIKY